MKLHILPNMGSFHSFAVDLADLKLSCIKTASLGQLPEEHAKSMHRCLVRHECLRLLVLARHGSLQKVRTEHTSEFVTHSISSRNNFEAWHSAKLTAEAA